MIYKPVEFSEFVDTMGDAYSYEALTEIYDYLNGEFLNVHGMDFELDPAEIRGCFSEYKSIEDYNRDYQEELEDMDDVERECMENEKELMVIDESLEWFVVGSQEI